EDTLDYLVQSGLSSCELMSGPIEKSAGAPNNMKEIVAWRKTITSMDKFKIIREMYNNAGVDIHIVKFGSIGMDRVSPEELEYMFNVAKTMGAKGITTELSETKAKNLGPLADKHGIAIGFHNHTQLKPTTYSEGPYFSYGKSIMANLDIGHYAAGTGQSPLPLVNELGNQGRLLSIHVKDRTFDGKTVPFGEGDAQIAEILQLIKKNKWDVFCDIELEYRIPEGSDAIKEVRKCVEYCKNALV
ncbi:MAG: sugar phosphate isomerase/epimerase, partial [Bacteroidales bacterium]|nr:sugar phosphate isomerase/epimerase [Bacteroidales bacterium]